LFGQILFVLCSDFHDFLNLSLVVLNASFQIIILSFENISLCCLDFINHDRRAGVAVRLEAISLDPFLVQLILQAHELSVQFLVFIINHFAKLFHFIKVDFVCQVLIQMLVHFVKNSRELCSMLSAQILSLFKFNKALLHL